MFWKDNKYLILTVTGFGVCFILFYFFLFRVFLEKTESNRETLQDLGYELYHDYYREASVADHIMNMDHYYDLVKSLKKTKKENVLHLGKKLSLKPVGDFIIAEFEKNQGAYFKKILDRKRTDLLMLSSRRNIDIPADLGFGDEIPPDNEADDLMKFLLIKDRLVQIAVDSGVAAVTSIEHLTVIRTGPDRETRFITEFPVKIKLQSTLNNTLKVLYKLRSENQFLVLRNLEVTSDNDDFSDKQNIFGVTIHVAGMTFSDIAEEDTPVHKEKKRPAIKIPLGI